MTDLVKRARARIADAKTSTWDGYPAEKIMPGWAALADYLCDEIERLQVEKIKAAREGWFRAVVFYQGMDAESDPAVIAEADRRWPMPSPKEADHD